MKLDKKRTISIIVESARNYDEYLNNKEFLIVYQDHSGNKKTTINYAEIGFRDMYFLHMTGVKTRLTAKRFYEACINQKLSEADIELDNLGKIQQKLAVLPFLHMLPYNNCMIGDFINSGVMIQADYFVGDTKCVLSVGFRKGNSVDRPVTLYNGDIRKLTNPTNRVLAIFMRSYPETTYQESTYIAKDIDVSSLELPEGLITLKQDD